MPALKYKQDLLDADTDEVPMSFLERAMAGKSAATTLMEVGRILVGADPGVGAMGLCGHCRRNRDEHSTSQYPDVFCSDHCEQEFISSALASLTIEDCMRIHRRLERLLLRAEGALV
jgi:hypothetical protein